MSIFTDIELFNLLKNSISDKFLSKNYASNRDISLWKGQDIAQFQDDLLKETKATVSEKWFYTYFKSDFKKLPRVDMLNILAGYCGYESWNDFRFHQEYKAKALLDLAENNQPQIVPENTDGLVSPITIGEEKEPEVIEVPVVVENEKKEAKADRKFKYSLIILSIIVMLSAIGWFVYYEFFRQKEYQFCFIDADRSSPIRNNIEVTILRTGFTPLFLSTKTGCISFYSYEDTLQMLVSSPYHKLDTFNVNLHVYRNPEKIVLEPDDYKVMLYYYSKSSKGVKERIDNLNKLIADNALIYQVYDNDFFGVEILSKKQYINLVSLPTTSLKNYSLIESEMKGGKIVKIKFKIQTDEDSTSMDGN